jgi:hypothetical protein
MTMRSIALVLPYSWFASLGALVLSACGSFDPSATPKADAGVAASGPLLPWKVGNSWTYRVTDGSEVGTKVTTIGELEAVGGTGPNADKMANKVVTKKKDGTDQTISWQASTGDMVVRYREQAFHALTGLLEEEEHWDPFKLHIDGSPDHRIAYATWLEIYQETKLPVDAQPSMHEARDRWSVLSVDEEVTVPAGTFHAIVFQKAGSSTSKSYWYVPGLGKVKETGGQIEELVTSQLMP